MWNIGVERIELGDNRTWGVGCNLLSLTLSIKEFTDEIDGVSNEFVLIPINQIEGLSDKEIADTIRCLMPHARLAAARKKYNIDKQDLHCYTIFELEAMISELNEFVDKDQHIAQRVKLFNERIEYLHAIPSRQDSAIIRRRRFDRRRPSLMLKLIARDGAKCAECGCTDNLTIDHIVPISKNGSDNLENLQILCRSHNSAKGAR